MRKYLWSALAVLCLALTPIWALAAELEEEPPAAHFDEDLPGSDALYDQFISRLLGLEGDSIAPAAEGYGSSAGSLSAGARNFYRHMLAALQDVADGTAASTVIPITADWQVAKETMFNGDCHAAVRALTRDYPYLFYWLDISRSMGGDSIRDHGSYITGSYSFYVDSAYQDNGNERRVSAAGAARASRALSNAMRIVDRYAGSSDYEKLTGYRDEICALVEYDDNAAGGDLSIVGSSPWQIVNVFDGDAGTNVVCEGYSKAFQYLCDRTAWDDGSIRCYMVSGVTTGPHMWNVVRIGGRSYLVDVTAADTGLSYAKDYVFLKGASGSPSGAYTIEVPRIEVGGGYYYYPQTLTWRYNAETLGYYDSGVLTLSDTDYTPDSNRVLRGSVTISGDPVTGGTLRADVSDILSSNVERPTGLTYAWSVGGEIRGREAQYTVQARDAGKAITVTVGAGNYTTTVTSAPVTAEEPDDGRLHGSVSISASGVSFPTEDGALVVANQVITLHVTPDPGYEVRDVQVVAADGTKLTLTRNGNDYSFAMPASDVAVSVAFTKLR